VATHTCAQVVKAGQLKVGSTVSPKSARTTKLLNMSEVATLRSSKDDEDKEEKDTVRLIFLEGGGERSIEQFHLFAYIIV
jgi:hypothetical protein